MERATGFLVLRTLRASLCSMALRSSSTLDAFRTLVTAQGTAEGVAEGEDMSITSWHRVLQCSHSVGKIRRWCSV